MIDRQTGLRLRGVAAGLLMLLVIACAAGCDSKAASTPAMPPGGYFRVVPLDQPVDDDAALVAAHAGLTLAGVEVVYDGPKEVFRVATEIWRDGQIIEGPNWGTSPDRSTRRKLTVGIQPSPSVEGRDIRLSVISGFATAFRLTVPEMSSTVRYIKRLDHPTEFDDSETPAVLALVWNTSWAKVGGESVEDVAKRVEYAIVIRVGLQSQMP